LASGAFRVIYYVVSDGIPIFALLLYGKGERVDLTPDQSVRCRGLRR
jgi:hypothetical protein